MHRNKGDPAHQSNGTTFIITQNQIKVKNKIAIIAATLMLATSCQEQNPKVKDVHTVEHTKPDIGSVARSVRNVLKNGFLVQIINDSHPHQFMVDNKGKWLCTGGGWGCLLNMTYVGFKPSSTSDTTALKGLNFQPAAPGQSKVYLFGVDSDPDNVYMAVKEDAHNSSLYAGTSVTLPEFPLPIDEEGHAIINGGQYGFVRHTTSEGVFFVIRIPLYSIRDVEGPLVRE